MVKEVKRKAEKASNMSESERLEAMELDQLVAKVREQNAIQGEEFEGFGD